MKDRVRPNIVGSLVVLLLSIGARYGEAAPQANTGSIKGRVILMGKAPANPVIRMGLDPMCNKMNAGARPIQEIVVLSADGGLANAFVRLQGNFPQTPVATAPVVIDQKKCLYGPRVVGVRVGQTLQLKNSDPLLHNIHTLSSRGNTFNVGQPTAGLVYQFKMKDEEVMLRLQCDLHKWMTAYIGVVTNPYFAVTAAGGTFQIDKVPAGTQTIQVWHERFGMLTMTVTVKAGATTTVDFAYSGNEKPSRTAIDDLVVPEAPTTIQLVAGHR